MKTERFFLLLIWNPFLLKFPTNFPFYRDEKLLTIVRDTNTRLLSIEAQKLVFHYQHGHRNSFAVLEIESKVRFRF